MNRQLAKCRGNFSVANKGFVYSVELGKTLIGHWIMKKIDYDQSDTIHILIDDNPEEVVCFTIGHNVML